MKKFAVSVFVVLSTLFVSGVSYAELPAGIFRLHMSSTFVEVGTGETEVDGQGDEGYGGLELGLGMSRFAIGAGFGLGGKLLIGAKLAIGQESSDWWPGSENETFVFSAIPYVEFVFLQSRVKPFAKAMVGIEGARGEDDSGFWGLVLGGGGGLHFFLTQSVSVDADLELNLRFGTGHNTMPGPVDDVDYSHWRFSFATLLGLSAWL
jgi:hypothetical protein